MDNPNQTFKGEKAVEDLNDREALGTQLKAIEYMMEQLNMSYEDLALQALDRAPGMWQLTYKQAYLILEHAAKIVYGIRKERE